MTESSCLHVHAHTCTHYLFPSRCVIGCLLSLAAFCACALWLRFIPPPLLFWPLCLILNPFVSLLALPSLCSRGFASLGCFLSLLVGHTHSTFSHSVILKHTMLNHAHHACATVHSCAQRAHSMSHALACAVAHTHPHTHAHRGKAPTLQNLTHDLWW